MLARIKQLIINSRLLQVISSASIRRRSGATSIWMAFAVLLGALFFGQIIAPQVLLYFIPQLGQYINQGSISLGIFQFSLVGLLFSAILILPFLIWFGNESKTTNIGEH